MYSTKYRWSSTDSRLLRYKQQVWDLGRKAGNSVPWSGSENKNPEDTELDHKKAGASQVKLNYQPAFSIRPDFSYFCRLPFSDPQPGSVSDRGGRRDSPDQYSY